MRFHILHVVTCIYICLVWTTITRGIKDIGLIAYGQMYCDKYVWIDFITGQSVQLALFIILWSVCTGFVKGMYANWLSVWRMTNMKKGVNVLLCMWHGNVELWLLCMWIFYLHMMELGFTCIKHGFVFERIYIWFWVD